MHARRKGTSGYIMSRVISGVSRTWIPLTNRADYKNYPNRNKSRRNLIGNQPFRKRARTNTPSGLRIRTHPCKTSVKNSPEPPRIPTDEQTSKRTQPNTFRETQTDAEANQSKSEENRDEKQKHRVRVDEVSPPDLYLPPRGQFTPSTGLIHVHKIYPCSDSPSRVFSEQKLSLIAPRWNYFYVPYLLHVRQQQNCCCNCPPMQAGPIQRFET